MLTKNISEKKVSYSGSDYSPKTDTGPSPALKKKFKLRA
jgi:hypothetical protein